MISVYNLKTKFQNLLMPLCKALNAIGVSPNIITVGTVFFTCVYSLLFYLYYSSSSAVLISVPFFFLLRMALNALDGMIATKFNKKTNIGVFYNELGDIVSDTAFYCAFFLSIHCDLLISFLFIFLSILTEYTGVTSVLVNGKRHFDGPMGKSDRAAFFGVLALLMFFGISSDIVRISLIIAIVLMIYTVYNRIRQSLKSVS